MARVASEIPPRRRSTIRTVLMAGIILLPLAYVGYTLWSMLAEHHHDPGRATTAADVAELTSLPPPPEARDFRVATFEHGQARLIFVRFSAPSDICQRYAAALLPNAKLKQLTWDDRYFDFATVSSGSHRFADLSWFDLPYLQGRWTSEAGKPVLPSPSAADRFPESDDVLGANANTSAEGYSSTEVRVDAARGVFYFMRSN